MVRKGFVSAVLMTGLLVSAAWGVYHVSVRHLRENAVLKKMIERLEAETRVAEVLVTGVRRDEKRDKTCTTVKFLEYDTMGRPLSPRYFTFTGNIIQFQSLVVRFDDMHVREADRWKGKSAYLFWKVFFLDGEDTEEFVITPVNEIPAGYKLKEASGPFEEELWSRFWEHALKSGRAGGGIKNAQIEAPGAKFVPGYLYTIRIEHDGGLRIDASPLSPILRGEKIPG